MSSEPLIRLVYLSRATGRVDEEMVRAIGRAARANNPSLEITGALCCAFDFFLQALEGPRGAVTEMFLKIARDTRHSKVRLVSSQPIETRRFAMWSMKVVNLDATNEKCASLFTKYTQFNTQPLESWSPETSVAFLHEIAMMLPDSSETE